MRDLLEAERARHFAGLAGSRVDATVPLRQAVIDAALSAVRRWPPPLDGLAVRIAAANVIHVEAVVGVLGFAKTMRLRLRLAPAIEHGIVSLLLDDGSLLASALAWIAPLLGKLPGGVTLEGRRIVVDLQRLADQQGFGDLARMVSSATLTSDDGVLWISARLEVPATGGPASGRLPSGATAPASSRPSPFSAEDVLEWLRGAHLDADVRVDERLANELIAAAHAEAQARATAATDAAAAAVARAVTRPVVHFEQGALRLTARAALEASRDDGPS